MRHSRKRRASLTRLAASPPTHLSSPFNAVTLWIFRFESLWVKGGCVVRESVCVRGGEFIGSVDRTS